MFPISREPEHTYIAGLSMGGYGTLVHALNHPERFRAFGAFSAAVQLNPEALVSGGAAATEQKPVDPSIDPQSLAEKLAKEGAAFPKAYIACGAKDFLYKANQEFRDKLKALGADVTWDEHPDYGHEWRFWNLEIEKFLDWLPRTDGYAKAGKRQI